MRKEPLSWTRRESFKQERPEPVPRWRDSSSSSPRGGMRHVPSRVDSRRPPPSGHGKQGGWHLCSEESVHGYVPSWPAKKMIEDESCRRPIFRGEGKYSRNFRDSRGGLLSPSNSPGGYPWHTGSRSPQTPGRQINTGHNHRYQHDKATSVTGLKTNLKCERERELSSNEWKPLKWNRPVTLSSRSPGLDNSSALKVTGNIDFDVTEVESSAEMAQPMPGNAAEDVFSATPSEEEQPSRKKPRLGWGEGLAKYEKKKVEDPVSSLSDNVADLTQSVYLNNAGRSSEIEVALYCESPATRSSDDEKKLHSVNDVDGKSVDIGNDIDNLSQWKISMFQSLQDRFASGLEEPDMSLTTNLIEELLQYGNPSVVNSSSAISTAMDRLHMWKDDVSKALETTESEIDSLENKLKSLVSESQVSFPNSLSSTLTRKNNREEEDGMYSKTGSAPLQIVSPVDPGVRKLHNDVSVTGNQSNVNYAMECHGITCVEFQSSLQRTGTSVNVEGQNEMEECIDASQMEETELKDLYLGTNGQKAGSTFLPLKIVDFQSSELTSSCVDAEKMLCHMVLASNQENARRASDEVFGNLLRIDCQPNISQNVSPSCSQNNSLIREKFLRRKRFLKFKERVTAFKFKAIHQFWLEDLNAVSLKRSQTKSQKKLETSLRVTLGGCQKNRSLIRCRGSSYGILNWLSSKDITHCTKLLSDFDLKPCRKVLKMPALILDEREKNGSRFISSNGLVEDPLAVEKERTMINPWTPEEREVFLEQLLTHGKDFRKIASFLEHKTTADCVEFYYKNHKSNLFQKAKKVGCGMKVKSLSANTYLATSGKRNFGTNSISEDLLDAASILAAQGQPRGRMINLQSHPKEPFLRQCSNSRKSEVINASFRRPGYFRSHGRERGMAGFDVLAEVCSSLSSDATDRIQPSFEDLSQQKIEDATDRCLWERRGEKDISDWTDGEKSLFVWAVSHYGKDFTRISQCVKTRSREQCRAFFRKAWKCLKLDSVLHGTRSKGSATDYSIRENDSAVSGNNSGSRKDADAVTSAKKMNSTETQNVLQTDLNASDGNSRFGKHLEVMGPTYASTNAPSATQEHVTQAPELGISDVRSPTRVDSEAANQDCGGFVHPECIKELPEMNSNEQVCHFSADASPCSVFSLNSELRNQSPLDLDEDEKPSIIVSPLEKSQGVCSTSLEDQDKSTSTAKINGDVSVDRLHDMWSIPSLERNSVSQHLKDSNLSMLAFVHQTPERERHFTREKTQKPSQSGDIKLFGQILSVSKDQKPNAGGLDDDKSPSPKLGSRIANVKSTGNNIRDGNSAFAKFDHDNHLGLENIPMSYGFWDGNRVHAGLSSAPLVSKYPAAFSPRPYQEAEKTSECSANGMSVFPSREFIDSNVVWSRDIAKMQSYFSVDMKQHKDAYLAMQRHNGLEAISSLKQQARGNGVHAAPTCLSDPVAAIRMHYARVNQFWGQEVIVKQEDSWSDRDSKR